MALMHLVDTSTLKRLGNPRRPSGEQHGQRGRKIPDLLVAASRRLTIECGALNVDKTRIRALHGHSIRVELGYEPGQPPPELYYATSNVDAHASRQLGLQPIYSPWLRLSSSIERAKATAGRRDVVLITIHAARMSQHGAAFYEDGDGAWISQDVDPQWLAYPDDWSEAYRRRAQ